MNLLMLAEDFMPTKGGGAVHVYELCSELVRQGLNVVLITPKITGAKRKEKINGFTVHRIGDKRLLSKNPYWLAAIKLALKLHKKKKFNVIHSHVYNSVIAGKIISIKLRIPIIMTIHGTYLGTWTKIRKNKLIAFLMSTKEKLIFMTPVDYIISVDKYFAKYWAKKLRLKPKIKIIENCVNTSLFKPLNKEKENTIMAARRLDSKNGLQFLIKAMPIIKKKFPNIKLNLIGGGPQKQELKDLSKKLGVGDNVIFCGFRDYSDMSKEYNKACLSVLPSLAEATSISAMESMACGKPVIASRVGGLPEIVINDKTGYLFKPGDHNELARLINKLLTNKSLRKKIGQKAREFVVKNKNWSVYASKTIKIYNKLVKVK